mgnify:FL=1
MKKIGIHGSTGSIGTQALEIIRNDKNITCVYLTAYSNVDLLISQAIEFKPKYICLVDDTKEDFLRDQLSSKNIEIL